MKNYDLTELRKPYFSKVQFCRHPVLVKILTLVSTSSDENKVSQSIFETEDINELRLDCEKDLNCIFRNKLVSKGIDNLNLIKVGKWSVSFQ